MEYLDIFPNRELNRTYNIIRALIFLGIFSCTLIIFSIIDPHIYDGSSKQFSGFQIHNLMVGIYVYIVALMIRIMTIITRCITYYINNRMILLIITIISEYISNILYIIGSHYLTIGSDTLIHVFYISIVIIILCIIDISISIFNSLLLYVDRQDYLQLIHDTHTHNYLYICNNDTTDSKGNSNIIYSGNIYFKNNP